MIFMEYVYVSAGTLGEQKRNRVNLLERRIYENIDKEDSNGIDN